MSWSIKRFFTDQEMVGREGFQRTSKTRANKKVMAIKQWTTCLKKKVYFFLAYFIRFGKRTNFVEETFSIRALFRRENSI
jgi:hypothetical protein